MKRIPPLRPDEDIANADWPKRTPDTMEDIEAGVRREEAAKVLDVAAEALQPPKAGAPPHHVQQWIGSVAEALAAGRELPPETREALSVALRTGAQDKRLAAVLGFKRPQHRPRGGWSTRLVKVNGAAQVVRELERAAAKGEGATLEDAVARCATDGRIPSDWSPRVDPLKSALKAFRKRIDRALGRGTPRSRA